MEIVTPIIASHMYPRLSQHIAALEDSFVWDDDLGLLYYGGSHEKGKSIIKPYIEKLVSAVKQTTLKDDVEIFSTENLWDLDAFELGEIVKIQGQYYNIQALYTYFNKQFSDYDPFYYETTHVELDEEDDIENYSICTKKNIIELPGNRQPFNIIELDKIAKSINDWWIPTPLSEFKIKWNKQVEQKGVSIASRLSPCMPLRNMYIDLNLDINLDSDSDTENYRYWNYDTDTDNDTDTETIDSDSREIDYPYKDPDETDSETFSEPDSDTFSDSSSEYDYYV